MAVLADHGDRAWPGVCATSMAIRELGDHQHATTGRENRIMLRHLRLPALCCSWYN